VNDYVLSLTGAAPVLLGPDMAVGPYTAVVHAGRSTFTNMGACSSIILTKFVNGQTKYVQIPGTVDGASEFIVGTYGDSLEVNATPSCGAQKLQQPSLFWYHPITNTATLFFGSTHGGGVVEDGFGFGSYSVPQQEQF
jgi:hypothetical protein